MSYILTDKTNFTLLPSYPPNGSYFIGVDTSNTKPRIQDHTGAIHTFAVYSGGPVAGVLTNDGAGNLTWAPDSSVSPFTSTTTSRIIPSIGGNVNAANYSSILGGKNSHVYSTGAYSVIGGGLSNQTVLNFSTIGGGQNNIVQSAGSVIGGGSGNHTATAAGYSTIGGGKINYVSGANGTISGGQNNYAGSNSSIGGGYNNQAGVNAVIGGGGYNYAASQFSTVGGGKNHQAIAPYSTVVGGYGHAVATGGDYGFVGGGKNNLTRSKFASILGGYSNTVNASAPYSTIIGGQSNINTAHSNSHIIGSHITADRANATFVEQLVTVNAGVVQFGLPTTVGTPGQVITQGSTAGVTSWTSAILLLSKTAGVNFNTTTDTTITLSGGTTFLITDIVVTNASTNLTTANDGEWWTGTTRSGTEIADTSNLNTLTTASKFVNLLSTNISRDSFITVNSPIYFSLGTPQGAASTADIYIYGYVLS